ncbi:MAG: hypothetical protein OEY25_06010 [Candidatus Aminicenantes bacterium]|nr:hypothetical protein [Candidatus Aminicenantes bacterium]MDH5705255.1 hypothetical protein [Candidatus Aminicenantes bacterium]
MEKYYWKRIEKYVIESETKQSHKNKCIFSLRDCHAMPAMTPKGWDCHAAPVMTQRKEIARCARDDSGKTFNAFM